MPTIQINISDDAKSRLDSIAQENMSTPSNIICDAINSMAGGSRAKSPEDMAPYFLSSTNRLILRNQEFLLSMCEDLDEYERKDHAKNVEILESGYTREYSTVFRSLLSEVSYSLCEELYDLLDMFRILRFSYDKLSEKERSQVKESDISFRGFDGNDNTESLLMNYARFIFRDEKYGELEEPMKRFSDNGNSHCQNLPMYRRMYRCFDPMWRKNPLITQELLSLSEIQQVVSTVL